MSSISSIFNIKPMDKYVFHVSVFKTHSGKFRSYIEHDGVFSELESASSWKEIMRKSGFIDPFNHKHDLVDETPSGELVMRHIYAFGVAGVVRSVMNGIFVPRNCHIQSPDDEKRHIERECTKQPLLRLGF